MLECHVNFPARALREHWTAEIISQGKVKLICAVSALALGNIMWISGQSYAATAILLA